MEAELADAGIMEGDLEAVVACAEREGLALREVVEMPANNLSVIFTRA